MRRLHLLLASGLLLTPTVLGAQTPDAIRSEVQAFVRTYTEAQNRADVSAVMEMISRRSGVTSVNDGEITRGWEALRTASDEVIGKEGTFRISVGSMDVLALGNSHAVVVAPFAIVVSTASGAAEIRGALSMVLEKASGAWKIVHEHYSSRPTGE